MIFTSGSPIGDLFYSSIIIIAQLFFPGLGAALEAILAFTDFNYITIFFFLII